MHEHLDHMQMYDSLSLESLMAHQLFGPIDVSTAYAACEFIFKSNLVFPSGNLSMFVNSTGGDCQEGFAIIDAIGTSRLPVHTIGMGNIQSMGVLILCSGTKGQRRMTENSEVMAHQFSASFEGKHHELIAQNKALKNLSEKMFRHFKKHTTMTDQQIKKVMFSPSDTWLTPEECVRYGLVDEIIKSV